MRQRLYLSVEESSFFFCWILNHIKGHWVLMNCFDFCLLLFHGVKTMHRLFQTQSHYNSCHQDWVFELKENLEKEYMRRTCTQTMLIIPYVLVQKYFSPFHETFWNCTCGITRLSLFEHHHLSAGFCALMVLCRILRCVLHLVTKSRLFLLPGWSTTLDPLITWLHDSCVIALGDKWQRHAQGCANMR